MASFFLHGFVIIGLVGLNAFFAAAEYALVSVRRTRLEQLAQEGDVRARLVENLLSDIGLIISGTQLGVTVVSLLMGWLGEGLIAAALERQLRGRLTPLLSATLAHSVSALAALLIITTLLMVLGELVPKALAYSHAEQAALVLARPVFLFLRLTRYPVRALDSLGDSVLRLLGQTPGRAPGGLHTPEEVELIVAAIRKRGLLGEEQEEMIQGVFDLHRVLVREIMVPRPRITSLAMTHDLISLFDRIVEDQHSRIPVYEGSPDRVAGILYTKDLLRVVQDRRRQGIPLDRPFDLRSVLHPPMIVPETMPLDQLLRETRRKRTQMALVVDEFGTFVGIVTIEDALEQIVGEIHDEYDLEEKAIRRISEDVLVVDGSLSVRDLADDYDIHLPRGAGYETLAGFVLTRLGVIPRANESFVFDGRRYTVFEMDGRRVAKVRLEKLPTISPPQKVAAVAPKPSSPERER